MWLTLLPERTGVPADEGGTILRLFVSPIDAPVVVVIACGAVALVETAVGVDAEVPVVDVPWAAVAVVVVSFTSLPDTEENTS